MIIIINEKHKKIYYAFWALQLLQRPKKSKPMIQNFKIGL